MASSNRTEERKRIQNKISREKESISALKDKISALQEKTKKEVAGLNKCIKKKRKSIEDLEDLLSLEEYRFAKKTLSRNELSVNEVLRAVIENGEVNISNLVRDKKEKTIVDDGEDMQG